MIGKAKLPMASLIGHESDISRESYTRFEFPLLYFCSYVNEVNRFLNAMSAASSGGPAGLVEGGASSGTPGVSRQMSVQESSTSSTGGPEVVVVDDAVIEKAATYASQVDGIRAVLSRLN